VSATALCDLVYTGETERFYADGGHTLDFCNKAIEVLDLIGWEFAPEVLPAVLGQIVSARGGEETSHWRYPIDLVPPLEQAIQDLPNLLREGEPKTWEGERALAHALLGEDPLAIISALTDAVRDASRSTL
jgi:hypothetical protein